MVRSGGHFDGEFAPHSRHKHLIFKAYFEAWIRKLALRSGAGNRLCVIDACAGPGHDAVGNPGSPLIAARAATAAVSQVRDRFARDVRVEVVAIEKDPQHFAKLESYLHPYGDLARPLRGTLEEHVASLAADLHDTPTLFFIDPFGLAPLRADMIRRALGGPKNEVFLLFADQAALRHFGVIQTDETRAMRSLSAHDARGSSLFPDMDAEERERLADKAARSEAALEITREHAIEILDTAFGGRDWLRALERVPVAERRFTFLGLYRQLLIEAGAHRVLEVPMMNEDGGHVYYLLHVTRSPKGYATMKEAVAYALRNSPLPVDVTERMTDALTTDLDRVVQLILARFAGKEVRWAEGRDDPSSRGIKAFVLEDTAMFPFQAKQLQERLKQFRLEGRTMRYAFPA